MSIQTTLTSAVVDAQYDADNAWLYWDWKGAQTTAEVKAACQLLLPTIAQTGAKKILNNHVHVTEVNQELDKWVVEEYLPELGRAGIELMAWVCCPILSLQNRTETAFLGSVYRPRVAIFEDMAAACTWLSNTSFLETVSYPPLAKAAH
jgi:hypothetical protein